MGLVGWMERVAEQPRFEDSALAGLEVSTRAVGLVSQVRQRIVISLRTNEANALHPVPITSDRPRRGSQQNTFMCIVDTPVDAS